MLHNLSISTLRSLHSEKETKKEKREIEGEKGRREGGREAGRERGERERKQISYFPNLSLPSYHTFPLSFLVKFVETNQLHLASYPFIVQNGPLLGTPVTSHYLNPADVFLSSYSCLFRCVHNCCTLSSWPVPLPLQFQAITHSWFCSFLLVRGRSVRAEAHTIWGSAFRKEKQRYLSCENFTKIYDRVNPLLGLLPSKRRTQNLHLY